MLSKNEPTSKNSEHECVDDSLLKLIWIVWESQTLTHCNCSRSISDWFLQSFTLIWCRNVSWQSRSYLNWSHDSRDFRCTRSDKCQSWRSRTEETRVDGERQQIKPGNHETESQTWNGFICCRFSINTSSD